MLVPRRQDRRQVGAVDAPSDASRSIGLRAARILAPGIVDLGVFAVDRAAFRAGGITRAG